MAKRPKKATSTALVVQTIVKHGPKPRPGPEVEKLPEPQDVLVPVALLLAADLAAEHKPSKLPWTQGVFLHVQDGKGRVVGGDGGRMFIASFNVGADPAAWLTDGILLSNEGLKARVAMIGKASSSGSVLIRFAKGWAKAEVRDTGKTMAFHVPVIDAMFPDYQRIVRPNSFSSPLDEDGEVTRGKEWEPIGINSQYLKHVGEIAKVLEAGLPKELRSKKGMTVRAFSGDGKPTTPLFFDFDTWPGAILGISPTKMASPNTAPETAALMAPAIRLTLAALRAHVTRNISWAEAAPTEDAKQAYLAKAEGFTVRIAEILKRAPGLPAIAAPEPEAGPEPASEADDAGRDAPGASDDPDRWEGPAAQDGADGQDAEGQEDDAEDAGVEQDADNRQGEFSALAAD